MSLTDDWKAGKLKCGLYWVKFRGKIVIAECVVFGDVAAPFKIETKTDFTIKISEVLSPCNYEELQQLKKENDDLSALITSGEIEISYLRHLLKECKEYLSDVDTYCTKNADESYLLLTRINAAIGESEVPDETR